MALLNFEEIDEFNKYLKGKYEKKFDAITSYNQNILLSAGAGCGKTTALSLRVLYQILCHELSVSDMLILTFTDNAAREMKDRIEKDLKRFAKDQNLSFLNDNARKALLIEADKVTTAPISTFDSFANGIVRKYAEKLNVSPTFKVLDGVVSEFLFSKSQKKILNDEFDNPSSLVTEYFSKNLDTNSNRLKDTISALEEIRKSYGDASFILDNWESQYLNEEKINELYKKCFTLYLNKISSFQKSFLMFREKFKDVPSNQSYGENDFFLKSSNFLGNLVEKYSKKIDNPNPYDNLKNLSIELKNISFTGSKDGDGLHPDTRLWRKKYFKDEYSEDSKSYNTVSSIIDTISKGYKNVRETLQGILPIDLTLEFYKRNAKYLNYAISLDKKIHSEVESFKRKNNAYSFNDISNMCLKLLTEDKEARCEERGRIKSIMVDEYQDSNDAQETLLSVLGTSEDNYEKFKSSGDKELLFDRNITFMVGDVKQSIYSFRFAKPDLFMSKYEAKEGSNVKVLTMEDNFRSNYTVVNQVNNFFSIDMTKDVGGVDYKNDEKQHIHSSNENYANDKVASYANLSSFFYDFTPTTIKNPTLRKMIIASDVARYIKDVVENKKVKVISKADGTSRDVRYEDFAILVRAKAQADPYVKAFGQLNIPCTIDINQDFKDSYVVRVLENLVTIEYLLLSMKEGKLLTEREKDSLKHCIASVERSFLLDVKDIKIIDDMSFGNIVSEDEEKRPLVVQMLDKINEKASLKSQSVNQIIREIIFAFDVYAKIATLRDSDISLSSFNFFLSEIDTLSSMGFGYKDIVEFFEDLRKGDLKDLPQEIKLYRAKSDSIMITTIHKSKGLEYPFVILPMNDKAPKGSDSGSPISFNRVSGFTMKMTLEDKLWLHSVLPTDYVGKDWNPYSDDPVPFSLIQNAYFSLDDKKESRSEQLRIIYVALTRARLYNLMIFSTNLKDKSDVLEVLPDYKGSFEEFGAKAFDAILPRSGDCTNYHLENLISYTDKSNIPYDKEEDVPPFEIEEEPPLKDELVKKIKEETYRASKQSSVLVNKENEDFGTKLHLELECLDWSKFPSLPDTSFIRSSRERGMVMNFVNSKFIDSLKDKKPIFYQEMNFFDPDTHKEGSIDLAIVTRGTSYVIDYKTNSVIDPAYKRQVKVYRKNLARVHNLDEKNIKCYLYSIMKGELLEVDVNETDN